MRKEVSPFQGSFRVKGSYPGLREYAYPGLKNAAPLGLRNRVPGEMGTPADAGGAGCFGQMQVARQRVVGANTVLKEVSPFQGSFRVNGSYPGLREYAYPGLTNAAPLGLRNRVPGKTARPLSCSACLPA